MFTDDKDLFRKTFKELYQIDPRYLFFYMRDYEDKMNKDNVKFAEEFFRRLGWRSWRS